MIARKKAGIFSPGERITPRKDLIIYESMIEESIYDPAYPIFGKSYLIEECYSMLHGDSVETDRDKLHEETLRHRNALYWAPKYNVWYRIKLYGIKLKPDRYGFSSYFLDKYFIKGY